MTYRPFKPETSKAVGITIAATSARVQLPRGYSHFRLHNDSDETLYLKLGDSTVAATASATGNMTIGTGVVEVLTLQSPADGTVYLAAIGSGATGTLGVTPGEGY